MFIAACAAALACALVGSAPARAELPGEGTVAGSLTDAGAGPAAAVVNAYDTAGALVDSTATEAGRYALMLPAGAYRLQAAPDPNVMPGVTPVGTLITILPGQTVIWDAVVGFAALPPGTRPHNDARDIAWLNAQRTAAGLPAGVSEDPVWSAACAAHDAYGQANDVLDHGEDGGLPGASGGGAWAGANSVLAQGLDWSAERNPWWDAPVHLIGLFTPSLAVVGIDDSGAFGCATTYPGFVRPTVAAPTITTYPGDGTGGFPRSEVADEDPFVPGSFVGLPAGAATGRELFVYLDIPDLPGPSFVKFASASLRGPHGPVAIKTVDNATPTLGGYLTGGIVIPVAPLAQGTTYTASVKLLGGYAKTWSFSTASATPVVSLRASRASRATLVARRRASAVVSSDRTARVTLTARFSDGHTLGSVTAKLTAGTARRLDIRLRAAALARLRAARTGTVSIRARVSAGGHATLADGTVGSR